MSHRPPFGRRPHLTVPAGACDTHIHVYDLSYPALPGRPLPAEDALVEHYRAYMAHMGLGRVVVVQANAYGDDNRCTLSAASALGPDVARAVVAAGPATSEAELDRLHAAGARGIRFMLLLGGLLNLTDLEALAPRLAARGWHAIVQLDGRALAEHEALLKRQPCLIVIDHLGKFLEPVTPEHESFRALLRLLDTGRFYVKLSGAYETSKTGGPWYEDVGVLARRLVAHAPERMLWASNWPHPQGPKLGYPVDADLIDVLEHWAPDAGSRRKILVDTPASLYGF